MNYYSRALEMTTTTFFMTKKTRGGYFVHDGNDNDDNNIFWNLNIMIWHERCKQKNWRVGTMTADEDDDNEKTVNKKIHQVG